MLQPDSIASSLRWMLWYVAAQVTWRGTPWRSPPRLQQEPPIELPARPAVFDPDAEPLNILCMDGYASQGSNPSLADWRSICHSHVQAPLWTEDGAQLGRGHRARG